MALVAGFLALGYAFLLATGLVVRPLAVLAATGLAIFLGWALTTLALSLGLLLGVAPTVRNASLLWLGGIAIGVVIARSRPTRRRPPLRLRESSRRGRTLAAAGAVMVVVCLGGLLVRSWQPTGVLHPDVWNQWLVKAKILYFFGGLDTGPGGFTSQFNPDYPPLNATSEALIFDAQGSADTLELARVHWVLAASFLLGAAWILAPRVRPAILWPSLALLALAPRFGALVGSSLADEPLAWLVGLGGLTGLVWLLEEDPPFAVLSAVFLSAATATKNEGLMLALVVVVALAATSQGRRHPRVLGGLVAAILGVHTLWRIWLSRHSVPRNPFYDLGDLLDPAYLLARTDRLRYAATELGEQLVEPSGWLLLVPATLVLALLSARRAPLLAIFVTTVVVLDLIGFAIVYTVSDVDLHFYVDNTVERLPAFVAVFCGVVFPLLLAVTAPSRRATP